MICGALVGPWKIRVEVVVPTDEVVVLVLFCVAVRFSCGTAGSGLMVLLSCPKRRNTSIIPKRRKVMMMRMLVLILFNVRP